MSGSGTILEAFAEGGYRLTRPRRVLSELIGEQRGHFTAEELVARSRRDGLDIGRATIFRSLEVLAGLGVIERLDLPTGEHAFVECEPAHHHHLVCSHCGRATDIREDGLLAIIGKVGRRTGYDIETHRLELFGTCPACRAERDAGRGIS